MTTRSQTSSFWRTVRSVADGFGEAVATPKGTAPDRAAGRI